MSSCEKSLQLECRAETVVDLHHECRGKAPDLSQYLDLVEREQVDAVHDRVLSQSGLLTFWRGASTSTWVDSPARRVVLVI